MKPDHQFAIEFTFGCGPDFEVTQPVSQRFDMFKVNNQLSVLRSDIPEENYQHQFSPTGLAWFSLTQLYFAKGGAALILEFQI